MASTMLSLTIDPELEAMIDAHVNANADIKVSKSAVVRDLLRHALQLCPTQRDAGWREGYFAAAAVMRERVQRSISEVPMFDPGPGYDPLA